jgi:hypothetical protein
VYLARSEDRGANWRTSTLVHSPVPAFFPYLVARGRGELAATWFTASTKDMSDLQWHVAQIDHTADDAAPRVVVSAAQSLESRRTRDGSETLFNDPAGEYLALAFLRDGGLGVVSPIQNRPEQRVGFTWWKFATR